MATRRQGSAVAKAATASAAARLGTNNGSGSTLPTPRLTKRELQRLQEQQRKAAEEEASKTVNSSTRATPASDNRSAGMGEGKYDMNEDFLNDLRSDPELEKLAKGSGMLRDGKVLNLRTSTASAGPAPISTSPKRVSDTSSLNDGAEVLKSTRKRKANEFFQEDDSVSNFSMESGQGKKKKASRQTMADKSNKGLRHFSMKVCQKVEEKQTTTYNEVADDLVKELSENASLRPQDQTYDEKNIRRRVYDALNVLMAMDIISKEKKEIKWKGLPSNVKHDLEVMQREKTARLKSIEKKQQHLRELMVQHIAFQNLIIRNQARTQQQPPDLDDESTRIQLPFITINTDAQTIIQCEMPEDRQNVFYNFSAPFEINDDNEILKRMGLHRTSRENLKNMLPPELLKLLPENYDDLGALS